MQGLTMNTVETVYSRKKDIPRAFLESVAGDTQRQVESKRVAAVVSSGSVESDLRRAIEVRFVTSVESSACNDSLPGARKD